MSDFKFRVGTSEDKTQVSEFLNQHFWVEEPTRKTTGIEVTKDIQDRVLRSLDLGTSTIAEDNNGNIVGIRLAIPKTKESLNKNIGEPQNILEKIRKDMADGANVFERFKTDKTMHSVALAVDGKYRGLGLGEKLYKENMRLARSLGYTVYVCDCTSAFSAKACVKLGFENVFEVVFSKYKDANCKLSFSELPSPPHVKAVVYVKVL
ncbi:hypothetical protein ACFFRR_011279 [Megaselia abdita]